MRALSGAIKCKLNIVHVLCLFGVHKIDVLTVFFTHVSLTKCFHVAKFLLNVCCEVLLAQRETSSAVFSAGMIGQKSFQGPTVASSLFALVWL